VQGQVKDVPGLQLDGVRSTRARFPNLPGGIEVGRSVGRSPAKQANKRLSPIHTAHPNVACLLSLELPATWQP
jgi:hypothetical protein